MRHLKAYRKLNRTSSHRSLMLRNLVTSLFEHERVETTVMKAKEARRLAERMITLGKRGTLHARRRAASVLLKKSVVKKLFDEIAPKYVNRDGGYTRILRVGYRKGDGAPLAFLELVEEEVTKKKKKTTKKGAKKVSGKREGTSKKEKKTKPAEEEKKEAAVKAEEAPEAKEEKAEKEEVQEEKGADEESVSEEKAPEEAPGKEETSGK